MYKRLYANCNNKTSVLLSFYSCRPTRRGNNLHRTTPGLPLKGTALPDDCDDEELLDYLPAPNPALLIGLYC